MKCFDHPASRCRVAVAHDQNPRGPQRRPQGLTSHIKLRQVSLRVQIRKEIRIVQLDVDKRRAIFKSCLIEKTDSQRIRSTPGELFLCKRTAGPAHEPDRGSYVFFNVYIRHAPFSFYKLSCKTQLVSVFVEFALSNRVCCNRHSSSCLVAPPAVWQRRPAPPVPRPSLALP